MARLIVALLLFLLSLLVVGKAPAYFLWLTAVAVISFPYVFVGLSFISWVAAFRAEKYKALVLAFSALAMVFFALPVVNAWYRNGSLPSRLQKDFPATGFSNGLRQPFSVLKMFTGIGAAERPFETMVYKTAGTQSLSLDFYPAARQGKAPVVIVVHGGSWEAGDSRQLPSLNYYLAAKGYHIAAINYRLAPAYQSPAPVEDTKDVIRFLMQQAERLNIDTGNIILLGRSAGGQIALVTAYSLHRPAVKAVIAFYSPADMVWGGQVKTNKLVLNTDAIYRDYFGGNYQQVPEKFKESSACEYVGSSSPPTLIIHGKTDALVAFDHSIHLRAKLTAAGVKNYLLDLPFATHGCDYNINGPDGQLTTYAVERFIYSVTAPTWKN